MKARRRFVLKSTIAKSISTFKRNALCRGSRPNLDEKCEKYVFRRFSRLIFSRENGSSTLRRFKSHYSVWLFKASDVYAYLFFSVPPVDIFCAHGECFENAMKVIVFFLLYLFFSDIGVDKLQGCGFRISSHRGTEGQSPAEPTPVTHASLTQLKARDTVCPKTHLNTRRTL